jgi:hypothetical protein
MDWMTLIDFMLPQIWVFWAKKLLQQWLLLKPNSKGWHCNDLLHWYSTGFVIVAWVGSIDFLVCFEHLLSCRITLVDLHWRLNMSYHQRVLQILDQLERDALMALHRIPTTLVLKKTIHLSQNLGYVLSWLNVLILRMVSERQRIGAHLPSVESSMPPGKDWERRV